MLTNFSKAALADPRMREANNILRTCVHCGFCPPPARPTCCSATSSTARAAASTWRRRCWRAADADRAGGEAPRPLPHLPSCMTTCPSGVHYGHLIARARTHIEQTYVRPWPDRMQRAAGDRGAESVAVPPHVAAAGSPGHSRGAAGRPLRDGGERAETHRRPSWADRPQVFAAEERGGSGWRCSAFAQQVLRPEINEATVRLLTRHGCEWWSPSEAAVAARSSTSSASRSAPRPPQSKHRRVVAGDEDGGLDAIIFNASGCGVALKDYEHLLRDDPECGTRRPGLGAVPLCPKAGGPWPRAGGRRDRAGGDLSSCLHDAARPRLRTGQRCRRRSASRCANRRRRRLLWPGRLYSILQPDISDKLRRRKLAHIDATQPQIVASGNIACITHLAAAADLPVVHTVELLDWATGGRKLRFLG